VECFELAWASAELLAAEVGGDDLFAVEAAESILTRLDTIGRALDLDPAPLFAIRTDPAWRRWQQDVANPASLAIRGAAVIAGDHGDAIDLDDETQIARDAFARLAREVVVPMAGMIHREDLIVPETILGRMRAMGAFGLSIPEQYGGSATDETSAAMTMVAVTEALSEASLAAAGSLITRPEILSRALLSGGTEAQKQAWLPRIAAGDPLCAIAITEPDYGSDVAALQLRATRTDGGWRLTSAKSWCTFAGKAGLLMVVARTGREPGHRGLSVLMVEKPSDEGHAFDHRQPDGGRLTGRAIATIGYRGMHSFDLTFDDWFVPAANLIGEEAGVGCGFYLTMAGMTGGRMQTAARASGVMRAALTAAIAHTRTRNVFGRPLADYPLTQAKIARMAARAAACRRLAYAVAAGRHDGPQAEAAALVKLIACRSAELITREALQLHGGMGYAEESIVSRLFVDARVLSIFEGAEETLALKVIARGLLARHAIR
jgi:(2S)-methylsuccinyl-CoA dehydrogenase